MSQIVGDRDRGSAASTPPGVPRWVKMFGIAVMVILLLVGIVLVTGIGGEHGPGRHAPPTEQEAQLDSPMGHTPPVEHSTQQP